jgi:hypothetical protein
MQEVHLFVLGILVITVGVPVAVPVITYYWHKVRRIEMESALKQDMLQRGMSAEDIKTVLEASSSTGAKGHHRERVLVK